MYCDQFPDDDQVSSDDGKDDKHDKENQKRRRTAMVSKMRKHPKLKSLYLLRDFSGWEEDVLLPFLQSCKKGVFKDFQVENTFCYSSADLVSAFAGLGMHLETFRDTDPPSGEDAEDEELAEVISMNPHLKAIFFRKVETAGPFTVVAIMQCQHLKALDLQGCLNLSSQDLLQILGSAGNLEQFWAMTDCPSSQTGREHGPRDPWIAAADMANAVWGMNKLETFMCSIRVPRPHWQVPKNARQAPFRSCLLQKSRQAQRAAYRHLALQSDLIGLTELTLGHGCNYFEKRVKNPHFQWYSLEMTLASGLEELACLKELTQVDVGFMNHRIGVRELRWMQKNWPKLECLYGLFQNGQERNPAVEAWIDANNPDWIMPSGVDAQRPTPRFYNT
ncbi:hypothetical protein BG000_005707 [Podila horticola]|nr:hypothetical protein BG000_005707 [Podila horticola]